MSLAEFLSARFAEEEARARDPWPHILDDVAAWWGDLSDEDIGDLDAHGDDSKGLAKALMQIEARRGTYARVLAEVEAKRRIVEELVPYLERVEGAAIDGGMYDDPPHASHDLLRLLALPHSGHPDYRHEWIAAPPYPFNSASAVMARDGDTMQILGMGGRDVTVRVVGEPEVDKGTVTLNVEEVDLSDALRPKVTLHSEEGGPAIAEGIADEHGGVTFTMNDDHCQHVNASIEADRWHCPECGLLAKIYPSPTD